MRAKTERLVFLHHRFPTLDVAAAIPFTYSVPHFLSWPGDVFEI